MFRPKSTLHCSLQLAKLSKSFMSEMSAPGQKRTSASRSGMSALPLKADVLGVETNVCFVP